MPKRPILRKHRRVPRVLGAVTSHSWDACAREAEGKFEVRGSMVASFPPNFPIFPRKILDQRVVIEIYPKYFRPFSSPMVSARGTVSTWISAHLKSRCSNRAFYPATPLGPPLTSDKDDASPSPKLPVERFLAEFLSAFFQVSQLQKLARAERVARSEIRLDEANPG